MVRRFFGAAAVSIPLWACGLILAAGIALGAVASSCLVTGGYDSWPVALSEEKALLDRDELVTRMLERTQELEDAKAAARAAQRELQALRSRPRTAPAVYSRDVRVVMPIEQLPRLMENAAGRVALAQLELAKAVVGGAAIPSAFDDDVAAELALTRDDLGCDRHLPGVIRGRVVGRLWLQSVVPTDDEELQGGYLVLSVRDPRTGQNIRSDIAQLKSGGTGAFIFRNVPSVGEFELHLFHNHLAGQNWLVRRDSVQGAFGECIDLRAEHRPSHLIRLK